MRSPVKALCVALLALALLPALARAEGDSSGEITYYGGPPSLESVGPGTFAKAKDKTGGGHHAKAKPHRAAKLTTVEEGTGEKATETEGEPESEGSHKARVAPGEAANRPPGAGPRPATDVSQRRLVATPKAPDASSSGSGGSSPVVPILIAVAVLAALSVGVVLYRERKPA
jgi:hypothetical protein